MAQVSNHPKHDIHKFRDIHPKLSKTNWVSWKRELLATSRDRGLYSTITGIDTLPSASAAHITVVAGVEHIGTISVAQLDEEWHDRNNAAYNQILLCITPELQTAIDETDRASEAWNILTRKFESRDPSKISIVRTRYDNHHMVEGQSVTSYLTTMKEYRSQLERMGETIAPSSHSATILHNLPDSWRLIAQTIRMIANTPEDIEERLEAHEADLNAIEISTQAATAFAARANGNRFPPSRGGFQRNFRSSQNAPFGKINTIYCNNCGKEGHAASRCYAPGGGNAGHAPWAASQGQSNNISRNNLTPNPPLQSNKPQATVPKASQPAPTNLATHDTKNLVMMAKIDELPNNFNEDNILIANNVSALSSVEDKTHTWLLDSGASSHLCGNIELFDSIVDIPPISILSANGESFTANKKGTILLTIYSDMPGANIPNMPITLINVIYVPKLNANLLSVGRMTNANVDVNFSKNHSYLSLDGEILAYGPKLSNLFTYTAICTSKETNTALHASGPSESMLWHHRLAHTNYQTIDRMAKQDLAVGFSPTMKIEGTAYTQCAHCPYGKQTRAPFKRIEEPPLEIGDVIVTDLCGPFETSINGYKYFVSWIDLKTRYADIDFLKDKESATVAASFKHFIIWIKKQKNANVKRIRSDNGGEYTGKPFQDVCGELGIIHQTTSPYTPEHNGVAERYNRTLQEGALTLQHDAELSNKFWVSAIDTINFVRNRILHSKIGVTPYEAFWGIKPRIDWLRTYGSRCWALIPKQVRKKGEYKSVEGIFVGYFKNSRSYKIWIPKTRSLIKTRDAIFDESNHIERITLLTKEEEDDLPELWTKKDFFISKTPTQAPSPEIVWTEEGGLPFEPAEEDKEVTREKERPEAEEEASIREGYEEVPDQAPQEFEKGGWLDPSDTAYGKGKRHQALLSDAYTLTENTFESQTHETAFVVLAEDEPASYKEAMKSENAEHWKKACQAEYETLLGYRTWDLVPRPPKTNIVGSRWTFRVKRDNLGNLDKFKARVVAQGFSQIPGVDFTETYSPTIRLTSIRFILAYACQNNLELKQVDIKGAYLNGRLDDDDVYMRQPDGFIVQGKEDFVCKLNKGMYGLKQSGRVWHHTLRSELQKIGFTPGLADTTVFFRTSSDGSTDIAGWYVDDGLLASHSTQTMEKMVKDIKGTFEIQDLGDPSRLLGVQIIRNRSEGTIHISQASFITTLSKRFNIPPAKSIRTPMEEKVALRVASPKNTTAQVPYSSMIGSLNYCSLFTRPDISFAVNKCAQFTSNPTLEHWAATNRILRYLIHTKDYGIIYKYDGSGIEGYNHTLIGYTDADYAGDVNDRKSTTGWIFTFNGSPICWSSKKQNIVSRSTMEAEAIAGSFTSVEGTWLSKLGKDFNVIFKPIPIFTDNESFISFCKNEVNNNRTKHIDIHYHYTKNEIIAGNIELHHISSADNPADILTKPLSPRKHQHLLKVIGICRA